MIRILIFAVLIIFSNTSYSQNLIGMSFKEVSKYLQAEEMPSTVEKKRDRDVTFLEVVNNEGVRIYYFSKDGVCNLYSFSIWGLNVSELENVLISIGYRKDGNFYINEPYKARIIQKKKDQIWICYIFQL